MLTLAAGSTLAGRYEVRAAIARRPAGLFYRGYDRQMGVEVALRVIDDELLVDEEERRTFVLRAGRARSLQHPNLIRLYDILVDDAAVFLVMQWAPGDRLSRLLELGPVALPQLRTLIRRAAAGIAHAHQHGVVLGNIRPDTVMLYPDGLKLTNVGIGPALPRPRFLAMIERIGRRDELAPELIAGKEPDERCDVYALARLAQTLLGGLPDGPALLLRTRPLLARALMADPTERPRGIESFVRELEGALDAEGSLPDTAVSAPSLPTGLPQALGEHTDPGSAGIALDLERGTEEGPTQLRPPPAEPSQIVELTGDELVEVAVPSGEGVTVPLPRFDEGSGTLVEITNVARRTPVRDDEEEVTYLPPPIVEPMVLPPDPAPLPSVPIKLEPAFDLEITNHVPRDRAPAPAQEAAAPAAASVPAPPAVAASMPAVAVTPPAPAAVAKPQHGRTVFVLAVLGLSVGVVAAVALWKASATPKRIAAVKPAASPVPAPSPSPSPNPSPIATPSTAPTAPAATSDGPCPVGMALLTIPHRACIDEYEYPGGHTIPRTSVSFDEAAQICRDRGLRLCSDPEWEAACRGPSSSSYPYGSSYDPSRCNTGGKPTPGAIVESGTLARCKSAAGAYDMSGNVAEWTASGNQRGGSALSGAPTMRCSHVVRKPDSKGAADVGFRCCGDAR